MPILPSLRRTALAALAAAAPTALLPSGSSAASPQPAPKPAQAVRTIKFLPLSAVERQFIYRNLGSQEIESERTRFQDGGSYIVYRFAFRPNTRASLAMRITAQFKVELSSDGERFDLAGIYTRDSGEPLTLDLSPYTRKGGFVYLRAGDGKPDDGWGGKIHQVTVTGAFRNAPIGRIADIKPLFLPRRDNLYARLAQPERRLYHFAAEGCSAEESILFRTLQGLVNRDRNELLIADRNGMSREMLRQGRIDGVETIPDAAALFRRYPRRDAVVYDPALHGSENLAVIIGSMEGWVVAHPELVQRYGLRVRMDLRGRWKRTLDGYKELYARYKARFNRRTLVLSAPTKRPGLYDYAMAHRTFTFWIVGGTDADKPGADRWAEEEWFERTLSRDFPVNIPILGYPQVEPSDGIGENRGVALFSRCGKYLVPADHMGNMSLLSAFPSARGTFTMPAVHRMPLDRGKVYASLVLSDGDNQCLWNGPGSFMLEYMRRMREKGPRGFAVSYTMGPNIVDLNPVAFSMLKTHLEPQDSVGGAVSGVGYMYMSAYGDNFGKDRGRVVQDYIAQTSAYLGHAGERWNWIMDYGGPGSARLKDYAGLRNCVALMGGYGRETTDPARTAEPVGDAVAFHSVSRMVDKDDVYRDVRQVMDKGVRPLFLHVFIGNWGLNADQYRELADRLIADGVEVVMPETLADLYKQSRKP